MKCKTEAWKLGWSFVISDLGILRYQLDRQLYIESLHYEINKFLFRATDEYKEYAEGMLAAINLFEKTGIVPNN